ncbi:MAG: BMC domain-containing protein [Lachnospiraceae bacterium]
MITIGFLELNSIARGIEAADHMLKTAEVELLSARPSCPGKYQILISGEVSAVDAALSSGESVASKNVIDKLVIPRIHPQVIAAIYMASDVTSQIKALGVLEFFSVTGAIIAADTAVKAASVSLIEIRLGTGIGGKSFVTFSGDISSVEAAAAAGMNTARESAALIDYAVIANPSPELYRCLI